MRRELDNGKGFIEVTDHLGTDLTVVNSARVSFGNRKDAIDDRDRKLMRYLARNKHWSPFRHIMVQFRVRAPEFVMRQWYKHVVGAETTSSYPTKDHAWNEISGRYKPVDEFHFPQIWREQSEDNKQGSSGVISERDQVQARDVYAEALGQAVAAYRQLMALGVAKEQARLILPLSQYTEVYWTASFQAIANFIELRDDTHAQEEIRQYAHEMREIMDELYPETMGAWFRGGGA